MTDQPLQRDVGGAAANVRDSVSTVSIPTISTRVLINSSIKSGILNINISGSDRLPIDLQAADEQNNRLKQFKRTRASVCLPCETVSAQLPQLQNNFSALRTNEGVARDAVRRDARLIPAG